MAKNIKIDKDGYLEILDKVLDNLKEERELALDRYRKADDLMVTIDQFALLGKNAVSFLTLASTTTSSMALLAKEIKSIVYKEDAPQDIDSTISNDFKNKVSRLKEDEDRAAPNSPNAPNVSDKPKTEE